MKKTAVFGLVFTLLTGLGSQSLAIVNGTLVDKKTIGSGGAEDYVLALRAESSGNDGSMTIGYCTAVIVAPNAALTAAHCVRDSRAKVFLVAGVSAENRKRLAVKAVFIKPNYNVNSLSDPNSQLNDIAIIQLKKNIAEPQRIARLPESSEMLPVDQSFNILGYGMPQLKYADIDNPDLGKLRQGQNVISSQIPGLIIINQTLNAGICQGDSGSPLLQGSASGFTAWGVARHASGSEPKQAVSKSVGESKDLREKLKANPGMDFCKFYGQYSDLRGHVDWIKAKLAEIR